MEELLSLGIILKTRGLKGEVKVKSFTDFASIRYKKGNKVYLYNERNNDLIEVHVSHYSFIQGFDYVIFKEYPTIEQITPFLNYEIVVKKDEQPKLSDDSYYFSDLISLNVINQNNENIGKVIKIEQFSANETLRIRLNNSKDLLLPFMKAFIKKVDLENKAIYVNLIEGMIE